MECFVCETSIFFMIRLVSISIEAGTTPMWYALVGLDGLAIGLDHFGASAPYKKLAQEFGFTPEGIVEDIKDFFSCDCGCDDEDCDCGCHGDK